MFSVARGLDNQGLFLLVPSRPIHFFLGDGIDALIEGHQHDRNLFLPQRIGIRGQELREHGGDGHLMNGAFHVHVDNEDGVRLDVVHVKDCHLVGGQFNLGARLFWSLLFWLIHFVYLSILDKSR